MDQSKRRILIIDDNHQITNFLKEKLEPLGYDTVLAHDGVSGLKYFEQSNPNLVLLDVILPSINGFDILRKVRESSDVPVIVLCPSQSDRFEAIRLGANSFVVKPFNFGYLASKINLVVEP